MERSAVGALCRPEGAGTRHRARAMYRKSRGLRARTFEAACRSSEAASDLYEEECATQPTSGQIWSGA